MDDKVIYLFFGLPYWQWILIILSFFTIFGAFIYFLVKIGNISYFGFSKEGVKLKSFYSNSAILKFREYQTLSHMLSDTLTIVKDIYREACLHNGFVKKEDSEYELYIKTKIERIWSGKNKSFILNQNDFELLSKEDFDDDVLNKKISDLLKDTFVDIRKISVEQHIDIDRCVREKDEYIANELKIIDEIYKKTNTLDYSRINTLLTNISFKLVDIHDKRTRNLTAKQMRKVEENLLYLKQIILDHFNEILSSKIKEKK